ncbi:MAG TPA: c-type cytochrome domain-containing protein, partial [Chryseolinea sp.]|nr:c-type cytochrome domain-containing protein [Chryseolinea sp.]
MSDSNLSSTRKLLIVVLFVAGLSFLAIPYIRPDNVPVLLLFLGRLHPLILHFPIVLIILALALEISKRYFFPAMGEVLLTIILSAAALASAVSIGAGYFLFASGDYSGNLIEEHLWAGVVTGAFISITLSFYLLYSATRRFYPLYFALLMMSNAAVAYASHLGGSVTHGQGYLTEHLQLMLNDSNEDTGRPEGQELVFQDMLAPIIEAKCASCHNAQRAKGGLKLTVYQDMFKSGDSDNPGIRAGAPDQSEVLKRILLPTDHKDHMPPE